MPCLPAMTGFFFEPMVILAKPPDVGCKNHLAGARKKPLKNMSESQ